MKKQIIAFIFAIFLAGCSHNIVTYGDGIALETTLRPDSGNFGVIFRYGKILSIAARENFEATMSGDGKTDTDNANASASGAVTVKVGPQITGYYVKAIEAGANKQELDNYLNEKK